MLHQSSGNWRLGLTLALTTMVFWATLPAALEIALTVLDPYTLTWFRFLVAFTVTLVWLAWRRRLGRFARLEKLDWLLLVIAGVGLTANYVLYLLGLDLTSPGNTQVFIQLAGVMLVLGSITIFKERFSPRQWFGYAILLLGLGLFFADQLGQAVADFDRYLLGDALIIGAASVWAGYALAQKQLLMKLSSPAILLFIYAFASVALLPASEPSTLRGLSAFHWWILLFCAANTVGAYAAFAEALAHWDASRVSAVLAVTPLATFAVMALLHARWPHLVPAEQVDAMGWVGACLVVAGSAVASLWRRREPLVKEPTPRG